MSDKKQPEAPVPVKFASIVWVLYGMTLVGGAILLAILGAGKEKTFELILALVLGGIGVYFSYAGVKTFRAKAVGTVGNGIGAMLFGGALIAGNHDSGINALAGLGLLLSGLICVLYRKRYQHATTQ